MNPRAVPVLFLAICLGAAAFGKSFGWLSLLIDPGSPIAAVSVLSLIAFHLVPGWKVYKLSRESIDGYEDKGRGVSFGDVNVEQQGARRNARASEAARIAEFTEETKRWIVARETRGRLTYKPEVTSCNRMIAKRKTL